MACETSMYAIKTLCMCMCGEIYSYTYMFIHACIYVCMTGVYLFWYKMVKGVRIVQSSILNLYCKYGT